MPLKLLLIRHGESLGNQARRMAGHTQDGLTIAGQQQCQQLAQYLFQQGWQPTHIYCSPLQRAVDSLAYLLRPWGWPLPDNRPLAVAANPEQPTDTRSATAPPITFASDLMEFQAGILTNLTWPEAVQRYPHLCHELTTSLDWIPIPDAETPQAGHDRAQRFVTQLLATHRQHEAIWVISHHWILEHLIAVLMGCDRTWQLSIPNTGLFEFWFDRDRWDQTGMAPYMSDLWQIKAFGICPHLPAPTAP